MPDGVGFTSRAGAGPPTTSADTILLHPPRARITFRVGVVGHRWNRLPKAQAERGALTARIGAVLETIRSEVGAFAARHPDAAFYDGPEPAPRRDTARHRLADWARRVLLVTPPPAHPAVQPCTLRAISPLAEGADRIFARQALDRGFELSCPMPFFQAEFEKDFKPAASVDEFRGLLDEARDGAGLVAFELDGKRADAPAAYGAAGRVVMNQSDLLVAVWDGRPAQGGGGAVDTLHEAIGFHVPVLWIAAVAPFGWKLIRSESDLPPPDREGVYPLPGPPSAHADGRDHDLVQAIRGVVVDELALPKALPASKSDKHDAALTKPVHRKRPAASPDQEAKAHASDFFQEARPFLNLHVSFLWKLFRDLVGSHRLSLPDLYVRDFVGQTRAEWPIETDRPAPSKAAGWANCMLRAHFAWADKRADLYADAERSASILIGVLAAMAVLVALLPVAMAWDHEDKAADAAAIASEFGILMLLVVLLRLSSMRRWRQRWLEYRVLAELVRQLRLLIPLGGGRPVPRTPPHLAVYGDPTRSWMYWQARAVGREVGLPDARLTQAYLDDCLGYLGAVAADPETGQLCFHLKTRQRSERIHEFLHRGSGLLFGVTLLSTIAHLLLQIPSGEVGWLPRLPERYAALVPLSEDGTLWLVLIAGFFPALGAAFAGINNQGEFVRLAKRSHAMADSFERFDAEIRKVKAAAETRLADLLPVANRMSQAMVDENLDWRVVVNDPPQSSA